MTVSSTTTKTARLPTDGSNDTFAFGFYAADDTHVAVALLDDDGLQTIVDAADYTVSRNADQSSSPGGDVVFDTAPATGQYVVVYSAIPRTQASALTSQGSQFPAVAEASLDKVTRLASQLAEALTRVPSLPITTSITTGEITNAITAGYLLRINAAGTGFELIAPSSVATAGDAPTVSVQAGTSKTVATTDGNTVFVFDSGSTCAVTLPAGADIGMTVYAVNKGSAGLSWTATSGSLVGSYTASVTKKLAAVVHVGSNVWVAAGDFS